MRNTRNYGVCGSGDPHPAALTAAQSATLFLGKAAPDTGVLRGVERPLQARLANRAQRANGLGRLDLGLCRAGRPNWEEELRVDVPAACSMAPIHQHPHFPTPATEKSVAICTRHETGQFISSVGNAGSLGEGKVNWKDFGAKILGGTPRGPLAEHPDRSCGAPRDLFWTNVAGQRLAGDVSGRATRTD